MNPIDPRSLGALCFGEEAPAAGWKGQELELIREKILPLPRNGGGHHLTRSGSLDWFPGEDRERRTGRCQQKVGPERMSHPGTSLDDQAFHSISI